MEPTPEICLTLDVSKNRATPKWMVKIMDKHIKMDDLGVPLFLETWKIIPFFVHPIFLGLVFEAIFQKKKQDSHHANLLAYP